MIDTVELVEAVVAVSYIEAFEVLSGYLFINSEIFILMNVFCSSESWTGFVFLTFTSSFVIVFKMNN